MNFVDGIGYMKTLGGEGSFAAHGNIQIHYPGRKRPGDYRLEVRGAAPTHATTAMSLYELIHSESYDFNDIDALLKDIYNNGTSTLYLESELEYMKHLIFWQTLQEEINYPRAEGNAGINLAFCRFYEAICSASPDCEFNIQDVLRRCQNHGNAKPKLFRIVNAPHYYEY